MLKSSEQIARLAAFKRACQTSDSPQEMQITKGDQEAVDPRRLFSVLESYKPDFVCGYVHKSWTEAIAAKATVYPFALDSDKPSFTVSSSKWMQSVLSEVYANREDRRSGARTFSFPATFRP